MQTPTFTPLPDMVSVNDRVDVCLPPGTARRGGLHAERSGRCGCHSATTGKLLLWSDSSKERKVVRISRAANSWTSGTAPKKCMMPDINTDAATAPMLTMAVGTRRGLTCSSEDLRLSLDLFLGECTLTDGGPLWRPRQVRSTRRPDHSSSCHSTPPRAPRIFENRGPCAENAISEDP